jgi:hypothetical protein
MLTNLLLASALCLPVAAQDTATPRSQASTNQAPHAQPAHRSHKAKKQQPLPPLPSGTQGPVPQVPLDSIPAVAPKVSYQDGMLTIVAPNSTLGDILRSVRKHTAADIDIPANANERVATSLGPGPARQVVAELLNGSHFNYILLGSPENADLLVRAVLVAKTPDTPAQSTQAGNGAAPTPTPATADAADAPDETVDEAPDMAAEAEQQQETPPDQPGVKTPQQLLQEMQQRQLQVQQQQQGGQPLQPGQIGPPNYPPPGMPRPQLPMQPQPQPPQEQQ